MKRYLLPSVLVVSLFLPNVSHGTTTFLEPGGDATFNVANTVSNGLWGSATNAPYAATDFVHGSHVKSIGYRPGVQDRVATPAGSLSMTGGSRVSMYVYLNVLPSASSTVFQRIDGLWMVRITSAGVVVLANNALAQIGSDGPTLSTGQWYRISVASTITDQTTNEIRLFVDGVSSISVSNADLGAAPSGSQLRIGNLNANANLDLRTSDHYLDNSSALTDPGNIWVTAKRPNANGTTNGFTTQIGSGGSGYGTGHSPQVNERPASTTNGWSMVGAGSAVTEEYNIENQATGDINITGATIVDSVGWVIANSLASETGKIIVSTSTTNISLVAATTTFTQVAATTTYPVGTGADIGIITATDLTTVKLYEAGVMVAYIPAAAAAPSAKRRKSIILY